MGGGGGGEGGKIGVAKNVNNIGKMEAARMFYGDLIPVVFALNGANARSSCVCVCERARARLTPIVLYIRTLYLSHLIVLFVSTV